MLFSTSLVAVVGSGTTPATSCRRLKIVNTKKKANICELTFPSAVLAIKLNRKRLVAVLREQIYIYDISCLKLVHTIDTGANPLGLCDLSAADDSLLVYPAAGAGGPAGAAGALGGAGAPVGGPGSAGGPTGTQDGCVVLFDALNIAPLNIVKCHKTDVSSLKLNQNGTMFATASSKGTIIRVFNCLSGTKVHEFRRGSYAANITSLSFSLSSSLLAVASDTSTVHIFRLVAGPGGTGAGPDTLGHDDNFLQDETELPIPQLTSRTLDLPLQPRKSASLTTRIWGTLPTNISSILEPQRDFAFLKLANQASSVLAIGFSNNDILIASSTRRLFVYAIPDAGGECVMVKQFEFE